VVGEAEFIDEDPEDQWRFLGSADACGERKFFAEASACLEVSSVFVEGTVTITDRSTDTVIFEDIPLEGTMEVYGYDLNNADLYLHDTTDTSIEFHSSDDALHIGAGTMDRQLK